MTDIEVMTFQQAQAWLEELTNKKGESVTPHLILGNGFSIAYNRDRFSYTALRQEAEAQHLIGKVALGLFAAMETQDFEQVIKTMTDAALGLRILDFKKYSVEIAALTAEVALLKDALARVLAALHPERPGDIEDAAYLRVRQFLDGFGRIFTASYDLLLYWALMQDFSSEDLPPRLSDDGFRDPGDDAEYVVWDYLNPHRQTVYYLHGALHLFRGEAELQKLTWIRTGDALIDQIRAQLAANRFPLHVAEGTSHEKLTRIQTSDYLSRALRSLAAVSGGMMAYGMSFSPNDEHLMRAIVQSKTQRLAVSLYGDPNDKANQATFLAVDRLQSRRYSLNPRSPLEVRFFDAATIQLW